MKRIDRAKQFMPFSPLKGYDELIFAKEKININKIDLSEDDLNKINDQLLKVKKNDLVEVVYFFKNDYIKISGMVSLIDPINCIIKVVKTEIPFKNIYSIALLNKFVDDQSLV